jgi:hypothetical protein
MGRRSQVKIFARLNVLLEDSLDYINSGSEVAFATVFIVGGSALFIISVASLVFWVVGWAVLAVVGIFTTVAVTGYWATAGVGLAICILGAIFRD